MKKQRVKLKKKLKKLNIEDVKFDKRRYKTQKKKKNDLLKKQVVGLQFSQVTPTL